MIDSLSRFFNCAPLINRASIHDVQVFMSEWVRTIGKPRRIITDRGGPTLSGAAWGGFESHFWVANESRASVRPAPKRISGKVNTCAKNRSGAHHFRHQRQCPIPRNIDSCGDCENHVPHAVTGVPPALAMTGRCDILPGYSHTAFIHDPDLADSLTRVNNSLSTILNARNAIITADASNAIKTMLTLKSPGRYKVHFYPGSSVQIAMNHSRVGAYRVVSVLDSNLILDRSARLFKWPKCKTRMIRDAETERFDATVVPPIDEALPGDSSQEMPTEIADPSCGSPNDNEISAGVVPP